MPASRSVCLITPSDALWLKYTRYTNTHSASGPNAVESAASVHDSFGSGLVKTSVRLPLVNRVDDVTPGVVVLTASGNVVDPARTSSTGWPALTDLHRGQQHQVEFIAAPGVLYRPCRTGGRPT